MNLKKILQNLDTKEPLLVEWAIDQIENKQGFDEQTVMMIEEHVFTDASITYMIDYFDAFVLTRIFKTVSARRFSNHSGMLIRFWPEWKDKVAGWSAGIIAQTDPAGAADLFRNYCRDQFQDYDKWHGVSQSLAHLPGNEAKQIANMMTDAYAAISKESVRKKYLLGILELAWKYEHPEFDKLFQKCVSSPTSGLRVYKEEFIRIVKILGFSETESVLIFDFIDEVSDLMPGDLKLFYEDTVPAEALDDAVRKLKKQSFRFMPSFFDEYGDVIKNEHIKMLFNDLVNDKIRVGGSDRKKRKTYVCGMILSCMMSSLQKEKPDLSVCSADEAIRLVSADIETLPYFDTFADFFKKLNRAETVRHMTEALEDNYELYGGGHVLDMMGELGYDEFLKPLTNALSADTDFTYIYETAENALLKYKDRAIDFFTEYFPHMDNLGKNAALEIVQKIGGPKSVEYVDKHFDAYMKIEKEFILRACHVVCSEKCLERLKPKMNKEQHLIDEACVIITMLTRGKTTEIEELLDKCYKKRKEQTDIINSVMTGNFAGNLNQSVVEAELRCKNCGDESTYKLKRIIVSSPGGEPFIAQEVECINCQAISEFEFTSKGRMAITGQMMSLMFLKSDKDKQKAVKKGPIEYGKNIAFEKEMEIQDAIDKYQLIIEKNPRDAGSYIGLGNIYFHVSRYTKAKECFNKATEADPSYLQPYYTLAYIANENNSPDSALELLEQGKPFFSSWKYMQGSGIDRNDFVLAYCDLYNSILRKTKSSKPRFHPTSFDTKPLVKVQTEPVKTAKKIGRNASCPCGSGKKYKKCCLNK